MLSNASLGKEFWTEVISYAVHLLNRLPSSALNGKCPLEVWSDKPISDFDSLHIFRCVAYYHVKDGKLDPRAKKGLFLGFNKRVKGYRIWRPEDRKVTVNRDITFDKSGMVK